MTLALACVAASSALTGCGSSGPSVQFGFNEPPSAANEPLQAQLGAPIRRMSVGWNQVQPAVATWDWQQADSEYASLRSAGLRPLIVAVAAPCWAHPALPCEGTDAGDTPPDPQYDGAWAEFVRQLTARYPEAMAIEIWNEPNITPVFMPYPDPARYTQLLRVAYAAVKDADPEMPVISGGLFASPSSGPYGVADAQFLTGMYASGAKGQMDGIGIHPYPTTTASEGAPAAYDPAVLNQVLTRIRDVRAEAADDSTPLWITEIGVSTQSEGGFPPAATEAQQADDLISMLRSIEAASDIPVAIIHRLIDRPVALGGQYARIEAGFGVFRVDGVPKQAACIISQELQGTLRCDQ